MTAARIENPVVVREPRRRAVYLDQVINCLRARDKIYEPDDLKGEASRGGS